MILKTFFFFKLKYIVAIIFLYFYVIFLKKILQKHLKVYTKYNNIFLKFLFLS